jgi:high frequency lysogenization protein
VTPNLRDQCIAFAAMCQAAVQVHRVAHGLATSSADVDPLIRAVFETSPNSTEAVYGSTAALRSGVLSAQQILTKPSADLVSAMRYVMSLLDIEGRLRKRPDLAQTLRTAIDQMPRKDASDATFSSLSTLYQRTISTLDRRVHVTGSPDVLQRTDVAAKIRSLLLAGVRSAWLWHQAGGRRWHLLLRRSALRNTLNALAMPTTNQ